MPDSTPPDSVTPGRRRVTIVPVLRSDADKAGGEEIVRRTIGAVACPDDPAIHANAADVVAALKAIAPVTPIEGRSRRAEKLTCRATELAEALARRGTRGQQRIVVEHVTVEKGANAVIGNVAVGDKRG